MVTSLPPGTGIACCGLVVLHTTYIEDTAEADACHAGAAE